ncbi:hypothetical protein F5883DRAFT_219957 [Diaporthe sp. PMI_573]|nr:hypothetical protein F5883DRAFT_219957 [Diaporthaceae sp. PMI_573]
MAAPGRSGAGGARPKVCCCYYSSTRSASHGGKEMLAGMLGHLDPSLKGAKTSLGVLEWSNEMAKARGEQARCSPSRQRIWGWRLSLAVAGRRLQRNRPPGERGGGVRLGVGWGIPGRGALFFLLLLLMFFILLVLRQYCQRGFPTRENPTRNISETNQVRLFSGGRGRGVGQRVVRE